MLFNTALFLLGFLPVTLTGFFLAGRLGGTDWALRWIVAASLVFYGWWDPRFIALLAGSIVANYAIGQRILAFARDGRDGAARRWLTIGVALDLALLGWFKYAGFLARAGAAMAGLHAPALEVALPLAISFFTFQQIMFLADSARADRPDAGFSAYAAFVAFFPHLIAGPIVRPREIIPQLTSRTLAQPRAEAIGEGLEIFLLGLAKKAVLADTFARFADIGFDAAARGAPLTLFEAWYALLAYGLQIYFDFSGYSDMAIGLARMLNVRFPLNFDSPYQARDIAAFWRRWHITLGAFLRDYVYIPLGGSRVAEARHAVNLMATMLLCGLWHGAAWRFVVWGGVHGVFLVIHAAWRRCGMRLPSPFAHILTLLCVLLAWVPFRAQGMDASLAMLRGLSGVNGVALPQLVLGWLPWLGAVAAPAASLPSLGDARTLSFPEVTACLALRLEYCAACASAPCDVCARADPGGQRRLRLQPAGGVLRPERHAVPVFPVLMRSLGRLLAACFASLAVYGVLFGCVLDRPLAYGFLEAQIDTKLARAAGIERPKLVILAGSNAPYSHRCELIEQALKMPCVNGGVAVGIGLDYLFARWQDRLRPGDVVYLPMEEAQYVRPQSSTAVGPDAAIMFRHDWGTLARLAPERWAGALFAFDLRFAIMAMIEHALLAAGFHDPRAAAEGTSNAWGDHVGHTPALGASGQVVLARAEPTHPTAETVSRGDGTAEIATFLCWARAHGVRAIGGWPTAFADSPMPDATRAAIRAVYAENGAAFLELPNRSLYPRRAFFDSPDHLSEPWQIAHSQAIAQALKPILGGAVSAGL